MPRDQSKPSIINPLIHETKLELIRINYSAGPASFRAEIGECEYSGGRIHIYTHTHTYIHIIEREREREREKVRERETERERDRERERERPPASSRAEIGVCEWSGRKPRGLESARPTNKSPAKAKEHVTEMNKSLSRA
jgi:hypothetical protein